MNPSPYPPLQRNTAPDDSSVPVCPNRAAFSQKLIVYRDFVRLGEWTALEIETLYQDGLLYLSDLYCRIGMQERKPLKTILAQPRPRQTIFSKRG